MRISGVLRGLPVVLLVTAARGQTVAAGARAVVSSDTLPVYTTMSASSAVKVTLQRGDQVTIGLVLFGDDTTWCAVSKNGETRRLGFASCEFLEQDRGQAAQTGQAAPVAAPKPPAQPITIREVQATPGAPQVTVREFTPPPQVAPPAPVLEAAGPRATAQVVAPPSAVTGALPSPSAPPPIPVREFTPPPEPVSNPSPVPALDAAAPRATPSAVAPPAAVAKSLPAPSTPPPIPVREFTPPPEQSAPPAPVLDTRAPAAAPVAVPRPAASLPAPSVPPVPVREFTPPPVVARSVPVLDSAPVARASAVEMARLEAARAPIPAPAPPPAAVPEAVAAPAAGATDFVEFAIAASGLSQTLDSYTRRTHLTSFLDKTRLAELDAAALDRVLEEQFRADAFSRAIGNQIRGGYNPERVAGMLEWLRSPATRKMVELERRALLPESRDELVAFADGLSKAPPEEARLLLVHRLYDSWKVCDMEVESTIALVHAAAMAIGPALPKEKRYSAVELDRALGPVKSRYRSIMRNARLVHYLFAYRAASEEELGEYVTYLESESGKWFVSLVDKGFYEATEAISRGLSEQIPRNVRAKRR